MIFNFTPDEARAIALAVAKHCQRRGMKVRVECAPWSAAPYRPTLFGQKGGLSVIVEAQGTLDYHKALKEFASWLAVNRCYAEFALATTNDATTKTGVLEELRRDGVGLLIIGDDGQVSESIRPRNSALVVTPDPTLRYGECKTEVMSALTKFNSVDRKDGLRDMCELVERETEKLGLLAINKGLLRLTAVAFTTQDWSGQINTLASPNAYNAGRQPIVSDLFKTDLHSFRGARNLVDHKVRGKRDDVRREKQFPERMMQGPRLVAELVYLQRRHR
ncbi:MAG TPA: hypothetical protein VMV72_17710 [Verrucomicrobiae bacterium]|nr:hypothetical protein [Verrucomicrobiae bacterium]